MQELRLLNKKLRQAVRDFPVERLNDPLVPEVPYTAYTQFIELVSRWADRTPEAHLGCDYGYVRSRVVGRARTHNTANNDAPSFEIKYCCRSIPFGA